ncbi:RimK family alpha-L-glutamate ligase [Streptomyces chartreusis]|uniref:ATP-grasp domain-containing protein n=1 Tax=Streptomyces chartreusis TaxID=1969 RepID=UPI002E192885|nr:RimK family alpha-L-glutamate ligase [Streptomyces chartreusis]
MQKGAELLEVSELPDHNGGVVRRSEAGLRYGFSPGSRAGQGPAAEHDVWLLLGPRLDQAVETAELTHHFDIHLPGRWRMAHTDGLLPAIVDGEPLLYDTDGRPQQAPRVVYARLSTPGLHTDREITLLRHLADMGAEVVNPVEGVLAAVNKFWHLQQFAAAGLPVPDTVTYSTAGLGALVALAPESEPCVVKSVRGNRGNGVFLAPSRALLSGVAGSLDTRVPFVLQDYIASSHGRDLRVFVVDGEPVDAFARTSSDGSFTSNIHQGGRAAPCRGAHPEAERLAVRAAEATGLVVAGVDLLFTEDSYVLCEINNNAAWLDGTPVVPDAIARCIACRTGN